MIALENISLVYGQFMAIKNVSLTINRGEKVSIVGQSGCGKSSLLHLMAGLIQPTEGQGLIDGQTIEYLREETAIVLQEQGLFPWKTVYENVALGFLNKGISKALKKQKIEKFLKDLGIESEKKKYLNQLSGGQKQRVAIARSLIKEPQLLLMDEPSGALDMLSKENFQDLLQQMVDTYEMTSVIVTHDIEEAVYLGQRILVMDQGRLLEEIHNPTYFDKNPRDRREFYEVCLKVRQVMKGD